MRKQTDLLHTLESMDMNAAKRKRAVEYRISLIRIH